MRRFHRKLTRDNSIQDLFDHEYQENYDFEREQRKFSCVRVYFTKVIGSNLTKGILFFVLPTNLSEGCQKSPKFRWCESQQSLMQ